MDPTPVRTRFAPSPTGALHLGNARTALFNWLFARRHSGALILRSEDTDRARSREETLEQMGRDLAWLGITADEGPFGGGPVAPYRQCARAEHHQALLARLREQDHAYPCYCTQAELAEARRRQIAAGQAPRYPGTCARLGPQERAERERAGRLATIRFRVPDGGEIAFDDLIHGRQVYRLRDIGDFVIARGDGTPAFFFANAVDDADMGISHVLRGDDHLTNTPRQLLLLQALGLAVPAYGHFGLITDHQGRPLSKREGAATLAQLRASGYRPEAVRNHLARVGVAGLPQGLLDEGALAADFDLAQVSRGPAVHDGQALEGWQRRAVDALTEEAWLAWIEEWAGGAALPGVSAESAAAFARAVRPNVLFPQEAVAWAGRLFDVEIDCDETAVEVIRGAGPGLFRAAQAVEEPDPQQDFRRWSRAVQEATGLRGRKLFQPLRAALTGKLSGPELHDMVALIGRERLRARLHRAGQLASRVDAS